MNSLSLLSPDRPALFRARAVLVWSALLCGLPSAMRATATLEARGYVEATTVGSFVDSGAIVSTGADSVTRSVSIFDNHIPTWSGSSQVGGTATFGALTGSGSASITGYSAFSYFQAQPVAIAQDYVTIFGSAPVNLTLHYQFNASLTVPTNQLGTVAALAVGQVYFYPNQFFNPSQEMAFDTMFTAGNSSAHRGDLGDASHGASGSFTGSETRQVNPGSTYGLAGYLQLFGEAQNLNPDGHQLDIAAAGSLSYWISFDSADAYLTSQSGATYRAPGGESSAVPETASTIGLLGLGLGGLILAGVRQRRSLA